MLITQYYCKHCITAYWSIDELISGPLTEVMQTMTQNGVRTHEMRIDLCKFLVRSDVTTFATLVGPTVKLGIAYLVGRHLLDELE